MLCIKKKSVFQGVNNIDPGNCFCYCVQLEIILKNSKHTGKLVCLEKLSLNSLSQKNNTWENLDKTLNFIGELIIASLSVYNS